MMDSLLPVLNGVKDSPQAVELLFVVLFAACCIGLWLAERLYGR